MKDDCSELSDVISLQELRFCNTTLVCAPVTLYLQYIDAGVAYRILKRECTSTLFLQ